VETAFGVDGLRNLAWWLIAASQHVSKGVCSLREFVEKQSREKRQKLNLKKL